MRLSLKPDHLKRYKDVAQLLFKYGNAHLSQNTSLSQALNGDEPVSPVEAGKAEELAQDLEKLGPTFIKIGQLLSTRVDLLAQPYIEALTRLQDKIEPFPFEEARQIFEEELGVKLSKAFSEFDPKPIAAASLGQVHRAFLRDGRPVAVKIQRPGIRQQIINDLDAFSQVAQVLDDHTQAGKRFEFALMVEEFRKTLLHELDYRLEARNLITLGANMAHFQRIMVPQPVADFTTARVLTMDWISGAKVTSLSPVVLQELNVRELADELFKAYLQQILVDGFFHADPHPGNIFITEDQRLAFLDLGMVARLSSSMQDKLLKMILAISEDRSDDVVEAALALGRTDDSFDEQKFRRRVNDVVGELQGASMQQIQIGMVVMEICRTASENGVHVPPELTLLGKTLLNLDMVGRTLDPKFDPNAAVRTCAGELTRKRIFKGASLGNLMQGMLEAREFVAHFPGRINKVMDRIADNNLEIKVDAIDEKMLMEGFQKVANRIASGLILAALIVGAAMLMDIQTQWKLFGYPGLAIILFTGAAAGGIALLINIFVFDERRARRK